eukprot:sb/3474957/
MTTAARPTFEPARGGTGRGEGDLSALSKQYSSRDLPGHTKLKYRQLGQETREEVAGRDLKRDLIDKERNSKRHRTGGDTRRKALPEISKETLDQDEPFDSSSVTMRTTLKPSLLNLPRLRKNGPSNTRKRR